MAGAYAAVVTLMHTIKQIQHHPRPPVSLNKNQVRSLTENLTFLQKFLEDYSHGRSTYELTDGLLSRIADAAYAAEDIIESHVAHQILSGSISSGKKLNSYLPEKLRRVLGKSIASQGQNDFKKLLLKVVEEMDLIKRDVMVIKETITPILHAPLHTRVRSSSTGQNVVVGFDDALIEIMDKLIGQEQSRRQIIPIVGMGGIGKTTLARNVYSKLSSSQYFDVCAWTTISQSYNIREIFIDVLSQVSKVEKEDLREESDNHLKDALHRHLYGRRYLIIMDDIWAAEVWDEIKLSLPDCENGSRVVATTRLSNFASQVNDDYSYCLKMKFLDDDQSWNLFCKIVFGEEVCPRELEEIGKKIAKGCKGLPLSISVIGGLLAKSKYDLEYWGYVAANLNSVVNLENDEECSKILEMSYNQLPTHLKPCFLHVGVLFPEDVKIRVSTLIELWVVEGFLKPNCGKSMEVVAREYFNELIDRNLILVGAFGATGNIKYCGVHDLLRNFCMREAQKQRFCSVLLEQHTLSISQGIRRVVIPKERYDDALQSTQLARSLYFHSCISPPLLNYKFLRIWKRCEKRVFCQHGNSLENMFHLVNLRYFDVAIGRYARLSSSVYCFWNLSTLIVEHEGILDAPSEIWNMLQLRHVRVRRLALPDPANGNDIILGNLQTLSRIVNFKCSQNIIKRIPNIKKLRTTYSSYVHGGETSCRYLKNIEHLCKLESFEVCFSPSTSGVFQNITFPHSLKKLEIQRFDAEELLEKIGSLPHLVKLKLIEGFFNHRKWVTVEGQFRSLKFLLVKQCLQLGCWKTESSHFPRLQHLTLQSLEDLSEIPSDIGEIPTLESINVKWCTNSVFISARKIKEEQEEQGNESLQVRVEY